MSAPYSQITCDDCHRPLVPIAPGEVSVPISTVDGKQLLFYCQYCGTSYAIEVQMPSGFVPLYIRHKEASAG